MGKAGKISGTAAAGQENGREGVDHLKRLGFSDYEARAYLALCEVQPATAYEVSQRAGLPKSNAYSVMRALEAKEAIQPVSESPLRYAARDPEEFFGRVARTTQEICGRLAEVAKKKAAGGGDIYTWSFRTEQGIRDKLRTLIAGAREQIWLKTSDEVIGDCLGALLDAAGRGVAVTLILSGAPPPELQGARRVRVLPHEGSGVKISRAAEGLFTLVVDFTDAMVGKLTGDVVGSHSRNRALTYVFITWFLHEFLLAEIHMKHREALEASFGRDFAKLRRKYRPRSRRHFPFEDWEMVLDGGGEGQEAR